MAVPPMDGRQLAKQPQLSEPGECDMALDDMKKSSKKPVSKRKKMALGRGLDSLIPDMDGFEASGTKSAPKAYFLCDTEIITPNRYQPRRSFKEEELEELVDSIRSQGVIQPLIVRKAQMGYELVAGERRLRAAKRAGLDQVPVVVKDISDTEMLEMSIVENIQRENLNPVEEADAYHRLITEFGLTQEKAAERVGKSRSAVANFLRIRQLPDDIKKSILNDQLTMGHARALLGFESASQQTAAWRIVVSKKLSVRETEALIKRLKKTPEEIEKRRPDTEETRQLRHLSESLSRHFGTKVQIKRRGKRGRLEIEFYNDDDLNRLLDLLNAPE